MNKNFWEDANAALEIVAKDEREKIEGVNNALNQRMQEIIEREGRDRKTEEIRVAVEARFGFPTETRPEKIITQKRARHWSQKKSSLEKQEVVVKENVLKINRLLNEPAVQIKEDQLMLEKLGKAGIFSATIVPRTYFNFICKKVGLFRIENISEDGLAPAKKLNSFYLSENLKNVITNVCIIIALAWLIGGFFFGSSNVFWRILVFALTCAGARFLDEMSTLSSKIYYYGISIAYKVYKPLVLRFIFPGMTNAGCLKYSDFNVPIRFPEPPAEIVDLLKKNRLFLDEIKIAADPKAIEIDWFKVRKTQEENLKRLIETKGDPILYCATSNNVYIICQFGDFPSEKKVMKWIEKKGARIFLLNSLSR